MSPNSVTMLLDVYNEQVVDRATAFMHEYGGHMMYGLVTGPVGIAGAEYLMQSAGLCGPYRDVAMSGVACAGAAYVWWWKNRGQSCTFGQLSASAAGVLGGMLATGYVRNMFLS